MAAHAHTDAAAAEVEASDANFVEAWRAMTEGSAAAAVSEHGSLVLLATGAPVAFLNGAFVRRPVDDVPAALAAIDTFFARQRVPFLVRLRYGMDQSFEDAAVAAGLQRTSLLPVMVLPAIRTIPDPPARLVTRPVVDEQGLEDHLTLLEAGFGVPKSVGHTILSMRTVDDGRFRAIVGYVDDEPVSTAAVCITDGTAGVYNVATPEAHRGRGYGEALTWAAVRAGAEAGAVRGTLQASPMGQPIYERMGFRVVSRWVQLVGPGPDDA